MYDKHLDYFLLVADCGSFSKAAEKAYISSTAIIKQINLLEADLGVTLFTRTNHGTKLTDAGAIVYHDAKKIINLSKATIRKARQAEQAGKQTIRIGTSLLRPCKTIVDSWTSISDKYPEIQLQIVPFDDTYNEWINLLENLGNNIDIIAGIYPSTLQEHHCQVLKIMDIPLCCAVSRKNPLSTKKKLSITDLYGESLMMVERGDTSYVDSVRNDFEQNYPMIHIEDVPAYDTKTFNQCDVSGNIMITIATWAELHPSLVTIPCEWNYTVPYGIMYSDHPSELVSNFIKIMADFSAVLY